MPTTTHATAEQTSKLYVDNVWKLHGVPQVVVSDRDPLFTSNFTKALCHLIGTKQAMSTAYHPQTDGQTERLNRVLEDMLRMYVSQSQDDWDEKLACAEFAINNNDHESTGKTPFLLNYGFHPRVPADVLPAGKCQQRPPLYSICNDLSMRRRSLIEWLPRDKLNMLTHDGGMSASVLETGFFCPQRTYVSSQARLNSSLDGWDHSG
jgi:transposase InsO family protein